MTGYSHWILAFVQILTVMLNLCATLLGLQSVVVLIQWNLSYPNLLGPGVVRKSEKSIFLKLYK